jgi:propionate CoA-transferase
MGIIRELLDIPIEDRLVYDARENTFYVNFENFYVKSREQIRGIQDHVESMLKPLGKKVFTIVNYDNFNILPELVDEYAEMVKYVMQFYEKVTRYTTSTFLRMKLGSERATGTWRPISTIRRPRPAASSRNRGRISPRDRRIGKTGQRD